MQTNGNCTSQIIAVIVRIGIGIDPPAFDVGDLVGLILPIVFGLVLACQPFYPPLLPSRLQLFGPSPFWLSSPHMNLISRAYCLYLSSLPKIAQTVVDTS